MSLCCSSVTYLHEGTRRLSRCPGRVLLVVEGDGGLRGDRGEVLRSAGEERAEPLHQLVLQHEAEEVRRRREHLDERLFDRMHQHT